MLYEEAMTRWETLKSGFPRIRRPLVGAVIKEVRIDRGIRQKDFAVQSGTNESTLKSIENDHQKATSADNLEKFAGLLGLTAEQLILLGRERDPCNYFAQKNKTPPLVPGIRKRKRFPEEWHQVTSLSYRNAEVQFLSPPLRSKNDFMMLHIKIPPLKSIENLSLPIDQQVIGFVTKGFNIKLIYGAPAQNITIEKPKEHRLTTHQGFTLNGRFVHQLINENPRETAELFIMTKLPHKKERARTIHPHPQSMNIAEAIDRIRQKKSTRPGQRISMRHLADLSASLDHEQIGKLMRIKKGASVIYWEKIEDLIAGCGVPMEDFLNWSRGYPDAYCHLISAATRAAVSYQTYHGIQIYTVSHPAMKHEFFCGEISMEGQNAPIRRNWERKDQAMIVLYVQEGTFEVAVGKSRNPLPLSSGESIYFDGSLGYSIRNPEKFSSKAFFVTYPAISI